VLARRTYRARRIASTLALLAAVAAAVIVILAAEPPQYHVTAVFGQVYGLVSDADVQVAGNTVGHVDSIWLGRDGLPHVQMSIDDSYRLRRGASAQIQMPSLTGEFNRVVALQAGNGPVLPAGATLGLAHTSEPVEIDQVLSTLDPRTRAEVRAVLAGMNAATRGRGADLAATLASSAQALGNTAALVQEVDSDGQSLRTLVHDGSLVMRTLATDPSQLGATADTLAALLRVTASRQAALAGTAALLPAGLRSPQRALARLHASLSTLDAFVRAAQPGVRELVPFSRALEPTLLEAPAPLHQLAGLITRTPADLRALTPLLGDLEPTLRVLDPVLGQANPILDQLRVRLPDLFSFFANWADFTADYDANGHAARVGLVLSPAPLNPIAPDQERAGMLLPPFVRDPGVLGGQPWTNYASSFIGSGAGRGTRR
jgi:phospholipid/cholesterol/gamma-HCH transport system substrate-binding protein